MLLPLLIALTVADAGPTNKAGAQARRSTVDVYRTQPGGSKIYVEARLPEGERGLFLVDTGADISVIHGDLADRLGLPVAEGGMRAMGITEEARAGRAILPWVRIGDMVAGGIDVAVDLPGMFREADGMPVDGLLGNNVWSQFLLDLNLRTDTLTLHRLGTRKLPRRADDLRFDGGHPFVDLGFRTAIDGTWSTIEVMLDTGATGLILRGAADAPFASSHTEGVEPIFGLGITQDLPPAAFLHTTRRVPIDRVRLAGHERGLQDDARWIDFERRYPPQFQGIQNIVGIHYLDDLRLRLDLRNGKVDLRRARGKPSFHDGRRRALESDVQRNGDDPARYLPRARALLGLGDLPGALHLLESLQQAPNDELATSRAEAAVLIARLHRSLGDLRAANAALATMSPGQLAERGELVAMVNGLLLDGQIGEARVVTTQALADAPRSVDTWVALADVALATKDLPGAERVLREVVSLARDPDAHLLRRARLDMLRSDRVSAIAQLRDGVQLNPYDGPLMWLYAQLVSEEGDDALIHTARSDLAQAKARLHPDHGPLDFFAASWSALGDTQRASEAHEAGQQRDCDATPTPPSERVRAARLNCLAWYDALIRHDLDTALDRITEALAITGPRADFLDTLAQVQAARGDVTAAREAASEAARMSPGDPYMLWQADRFSQLLAAHLRPTP